MVQKPQTFAGYQSDILTAMVNSGIQQLSPGGKARALCDIIANKLADSESNDFQNMAETLLPFATGTNLDVIGEIQGVPRLQATSSSVAAADTNFNFYVRTGTFGSINGGQDINIPQGVQISTISTTGPIYIADAVTLPADASSIYFSGTSQFGGSASNAAAGTFCRHNFTNYASSKFGSLLVTNNYGIVGGRDQEDDDNYRTRIRMKLQSQSGVNEAALRFAILLVPGIQDVVFDPAAGTFTCYVYSVTPTASSSLLTMVQSQLDNTTAYPLTGVAVNPDLVGISLATTLTMVGGATQTDCDNAIASSIQAVQTYINNLTIDETFVINDLGDQIRSASSKILDVGQPNQEIGSIYIWRSRTDGTRYSRTLLLNYTPALGERIVTEDIANAVAITIQPAS